MGYPAPGRRTLRRVARAAEDGGVAEVERRTAGRERGDVIDRQVCGRVGRTPVARAPVAMLTTPCTEDASAEALPGSRAVQRVVPAAVGPAGVLGAATASAAGDDTADRAQLHPRIVGWAARAVYSPRVLRLRDHGSPNPHRMRINGLATSRLADPSVGVVGARVGLGRTGRSCPITANLIGAR